jgi:hypothetical protein
MSDFTDDIRALRLSVQRAMLGIIVPSIRAISVEMNPDARMVWVYFDVPATPEQLEMLSEAEAEILADYHDNNVSVRAVTLPMQAMIPRDRGILVYARYEPDSRESS